MSSEPQLWYVIENGQQYGPMTADQLAQSAAQGAVTPQAQVWTEGLENWVPATQIEGLFQVAAPAPAPPPAVVVRAARPATGGSFPISALGVHPATATATATGDEYPPTGTKGASFQMVAGLVAGGIVLFVLGIFVTVQLANRGDSSAQAALLGPFLMGLACIGWLIAGIVQLIYLHRAWSCLRFGNPRTTPGQAVGMMFIPFFNYYWIFVAIHGFACDWNRVVATFPDLRHAPRLTQGVFLAYCICSIVFPPAAIILWFPVMGGFCKAINFMAFRPVHQPGAIVFR